MGYCSKCHQWLGTNHYVTQESHITIAGGEWEWQQWVTAAIGELLACGPNVSVPPCSERINASLSILAKAIAPANVQNLARLLGLSGRGLRDLQLGRRILQLDTLLQICYRSGITPRQFLVEDPAMIEVAPPAVTLPEYRRISKRTYKPFDLEQVQQLLEDCVLSDEVPPPSMAELARRIGHDQSNLSERFPELCKVISKRYRAYRRIKRQEWLQQTVDEIRQVMLLLDSKGIYPTHKQIMTHLQQPTSMRLSEARAVRRIMLQELGWA